jgi:proteasome assembly chaperone 2
LLIRFPGRVQPALSIGNVGQLAVDLLIPSSKARRVAYLDEPSVLPCAGNDAFGPHAVGDLALALEGWVLESSRSLCAPVTYS